MKFDGKTAVVTGGASGIGKATTFELARCGARVILADIDDKGGAAAQKEAQDAGLRVEFMHVDLTGAASVDQFAEQALKQAGRIDILVNTAGWGRAQPFLENPPHARHRAQGALR